MPSVMQMTVDGARARSADAAPGLGFAFAPVHKRALGVAIGAVAGLAVFGVTAFAALVRPADPFPLDLLSQYFYGYDVSWTGALIGLFWGFFTGFVFGWFAAFVRNLVIATKVFVLKTRADLAQTKDFLDHI